MSDSQAGGTPQIPNFQVRIPLEWGSADDIPIAYANQVMVSHAGPEFFLVFGVVLPPSTQDELPDAFVIKPQVRVVISREAMPAIVQALNDNLSRFRANMARHQQQVQGSDTPPTRARAATVSGSQPDSGSGAADDNPGPASQTEGEDGSRKPPTSRRRPSGSESGSEPAA
jgi:hypothetical protein